MLSLVRTTNKTCTSQIRKRAQALEAITKTIRVEAILYFNSPIEELYVLCTVDPLDPGLAEAVCSTLGHKFQETVLHWRERHPELQGISLRKFAEHYFSDQDNRHEFVAHYTAAAKYKRKLAA